ncbi:MAG TPA: hypothetical protein VFF68_07010, partial [Anaerolineaceae bacterium]|nr:hypothetical protein [Anaerolineaceae bacterium]
VLVFFQGFRFHFFALFGGLSAALLWPRRSQWAAAGAWRFPAGLFLAALLGVLALAHVTASLVLDYCVHCFPMYLAFFEPVGLLLVVVTAPAWFRGRSWARLTGAAAAIAVVTAGMAAAAYKELGSLPLYAGFSEWLFNLGVPRLREGRIVPGTAELWQVIVNRFGLDVDVYRQQIEPLIGSFLFGLLAALVLLLLVGLACRLLGRRLGRFGLAHAALAAALLLGSLFSASPLISGGEFVYDCGGDNLASTEAAGAHLAERIPPGAQVDWRGGVSPAVLLYLPGVRLYPPQLDDQYFFRTGGDPDELYRYGYWGPELSAQWLGEADYLLTATHEPFIDFTPADFGFTPYSETPPVTACAQESLGVRVYRKGD